MSLSALSDWLGSYTDVKCHNSFSCKLDVCRFWRVRWRRGTDTRHFQEAVDCCWHRIVYRFPIPYKTSFEIVDRYRLEFKVMIRRSELVTNHGCVLLMYRDKLVVAIPILMVLLSSDHQIFKGEEQCRDYLSCW